jgi:aryl-alcohol dehydrogenase-like predicted oxidoreductase
MLVRALGREGPLISPVGLGGWEAGGGRTWGPNSSDDDVVAVLCRGFDEGATWIDTAEVYAKGRSEEVVGRALAARPDVMVFTKVGPRPDGTGIRAEDVARAAEASLVRLGRDVIDLYQVHWRDPDVPLEETWTGMAELVQRGLVRHIGLSNFGAADVLRCERIRHVDALQIQGSLLYRDELATTLATCRDNGTGVLCYGPLAYGLLAGDGRTTYSDWRSGTYNLDDFFVVENVERFFSADALPRMHDYVARLRTLAAELGRSPVELALGWLLAQDGVSGVIVGTRDADHVVENVRAGHHRPAPTDVARLEAITTP